MLESGMEGVEVTLFILRVLQPSLDLLLLLSPLVYALLIKFQPTLPESHNQQHQNDNNEEQDPNFVKVTVKVVTPRSALIIFLIVLLSLLYAGDGVVLILHSLIRWREGDGWEAGEGRWRGIEWYVLGMLVSMGTYGTTMIKMDKWRKSDTKLFALFNLAFEGGLTGVLVPDLFQEPNRATTSNYDIAHFALIPTRIILYLALFLALSLPSTSFRPYKPPTRAERTTLNSSEQAQYGTFGGPPSPTTNSKSTILTSTPPPGRPPPPPLTFRKLVRRIYTLSPYLWPSKSRLLQCITVLCFFIMILGRIVNLMVPETLGDVVDDLTVGKAPWLNILLYTILRTLQGGQGLLSFFQSTLWIPISQYSQREMSMMTFDHLLNLSLAFHTRRKTGEILRVLDRGGAINSFFQLLVFSLIPVFVDITVAVIYLAIRFDPLLAVLMLTVMISYVGASVAITKQRVKYRRRMLDSDKYQRAIHTDTIMNWEVVKYFTAEKFESNRYLDATRVYQANEYQVLLSMQVLNLAQNIIISAGLLAGCFIVAYRVATGQQTVGSFIRFITYLTQLYVPLGALGTLYRIIQQNLVDTENLIKLLEEEQEIKDVPDALDIQVKGDVEFDNVSFSYDGKRKALNKLSFKIPAGTSVALVGESGAGKSSILRLMYRFYDVTDGAIKIDGHDIRHLTQHSLRSQIGVVPQDSVLFNETIRYNIGYGDPTADEEHILNAAKAAQIHDRVLSFPDQYSTVVGERGMRLSGGEKQRVSIARTILKNPPILLLDEATSALDTNTEREIQSALQELIKGRTTLSIAHRLSTIVHSDLILVIQDGTVAESGTHQELLSKDKLYAALWKKQISAELEVALKDEAGATSGLIPKELRDVMQQKVNGAGTETPDEGSGTATPTMGSRVVT